MAVRKRAINLILAVIRGKQGHNRALRKRELNVFKVRENLSNLSVCSECTICFPN